jgi:glycosyltransferase involved in cell wall biosynthesis
VIAGSGDPLLIARLKRETDALGIAANVFWVGMLEGADKHGALMDADMFVLPSYSENFGIAAAEAMAAGIPVVVSNQVGIHEDVARVHAGLVVPCKDQPLAIALSQLLGDPQERSRMGVNGQALVQREYSSRVVTQKLIEAYNAVVH